jgi:hypothetical protein
MVCLWTAGLSISAALAAEEVDTDADSKVASKVPLPVPDLREDDTRLKIQKGDFVVVPIPISNPTFDTGLVVGAAYFYPQTEQQKKVQPASVTGAAAVYTSNKSFAYGIAQQNYWHENKWRFNGILAHANLKLSLRAPEDDGSQSEVNWFIKGEFLQANISRQFVGKWYAGILGRYIAMNQDIGADVPDEEFDTEEKARSVGLGAIIQHDSRDSPFNAQSGHNFKIDVLFNGSALGSSENYQSYSANYSSYHSLTDSVVLAWEVQGCARSGRAPLWDACRVDLRGFAATRYLSKTSASGQAEIRWQISPRWGAVAFAGQGRAGTSFSEAGESESIPSYGIGARFMVLKSQKINIRVDYARSDDSDALYLSVAEAF